MEAQKKFLDYIQPAELYFLALFFCAVLLYILAITYFTLRKKKKSHFEKMELVTVLDECITEAIVEDNIDHLRDDLQAFGIKHLHLAHNRQVAIDQLINTKKNLTGLAAQQIIAVYLQLGLKKDSLEKLHSRKWNHKAKGIYELYIMDQHDVTEEITQLANDNNEFVRAEAQTALTGFLGFAGLQFLDHLSQPLSEWQQLKLLDRLQAHAFTDLSQLDMWLTAINRDVVLFALKLTEIYQQYQMHDVVLKCLMHADIKVRRQAIKTLGAIPNDNTVQYMMLLFETEPIDNQLEIIRQLANIGSGSDQQYLQQMIAGKDERIMLEAARALAQVSDTEDMIDAFDLTGMLPPSIYEQVKHEQRR